MSAVPHEGTRAVSGSCARKSWKRCQKRKSLPIVVVVVSIYIHACACVVDSALVRVCVCVRSYVRVHNMVIYACAHPHAITLCRTLAVRATRYAIRRCTLRLRLRVRDSEPVYCIAASFELSINGQLVFSKLKVGAMPDVDEVSHTQ